MSLPYLAPRRTELLRRPFLNVVVVSALLALCSTAAAQEGTDGALTVTAANTVLNQYAVLGANAAAGTTSFSVSSIADLSSAYGALARGDLLMLYQPQGASISTADNATFGAVTNLSSAGRYEVISVGSVSGNTVTLDASCGALRYSYATTGNAQVVRIPQFTTLSINSGASVVASAWNGQRGGVVAVQAQATVINGSVSASGLGFRGGALDNASQSSGTDVALYRSSNAADGGEKGESIAGYGALYDTLGGRFGRGAPANGGGGNSHNAGGGGGNSHNAGGGGGANGNNGATWSGQGINDPNRDYRRAWDLDPGSGAMNGSGGGRGGYTFSNSNEDATRTAPGANAWGGNLRRERGGLGGRPLNGDASGRLFLGGGGGAGDANNSAGGVGGNGGGLVLISAGSVSGSGILSANEAAGQNTRPGESNLYNDAPGGGGGGGCDTLAAGTGGSGSGNAVTLSNAQLNAGGGNTLAITLSGTLSANATGSVTNTATVAAPSGVTDPAAGNNTSSVTTPVQATANLALTKTASSSSPQPGEEVTYTFRVTNSGPSAATNVTVSDALPAGLTLVRTSGCAQDPNGVPSCALGSVAAGAEATFTLVATAQGNLGATVTNTASVSATETDPAPRTTPLQRPSP